MSQSYTILSAITSEFSPFTDGHVQTLSQRMNGHQILQTSTHLTIMCGVQSSGISQTSLKAQDHPGAKKCTAADPGWLAADND